MYMHVLLFLISCGSSSEMHVVISHILKVDTTHYSRSETTSCIEIVSNKTFMSVSETRLGSALAHMTSES